MALKPWIHVRGMSVPELAHHLGGIDLARILLDPPPGHATENDVELVNARKQGLHELIDGVLVEKACDYADAVISLRVGTVLTAWAERLNCGVVTGASAPFRFGPKQVRMPDAAFTSWERLRGRIPEEPVPDLVPNVVVEVVNSRNTSGELTRKLTDYFAVGVKWVWFIDRRHESVVEYRSPTDVVTLVGGDVLEGGDILPGFTLAVSTIFEKRAPAKK